LVWEQSLIGCKVDLYRPGTEAFAIQGEGLLHALVVNAENEGYASRFSLFGSKDSGGAGRYLFASEEFCDLAFVGVVREPTHEDF